MIHVQLYEYLALVHRLGFLCLIRSQESCDNINGNTREYFFACDTTVHGMENQGGCSVC